MTKNLTLLLSLFLCLTGLNSKAQDFQKTPQGIKANVGSVNVEIQFYNPQTIRIIKTPTGVSLKKESLSVIAKPENTELDVTSSGHLISITSSKIKVSLNDETGKVAFYTLDNKPLLNEKDYGVQFTPTDDAGEQTYIVRQAFRLGENEPIFGMGQFQKGKMEQNNQKLFLRQANLETVIPFFQSIKGYGVFWDNYSPSYFTNNPQETSFESEVGNCADYYFMYGGNADGVIAQMRHLTGQAPMFPYWTYGYWQSKERYKSQNELVGVVKKYREIGVPLDGIIQDWQYWGDNAHWNAMEFLNPEFPDPKKMIDDIHNLNAHVIISCWASFGPKTKQYEILNQKGMLMDFKTWPPFAENTWPPKPDAKPSGVKVYDPYNPEARDIYWKYMNQGIFSLGMDGWWLDSSEPDHLDIQDKDFDNITYLGPFRKVRNAFPLEHVGGVYTHQRESDSSKRVFILTRSAFAGQQRYGANSWSGDVVASWEHLKDQIPAGLNFSLSGIPYWNCDLGGFFLWNFHGGIENKAYRELYVRWLEFGTFIPMMRSHGTDSPREIYQFGQKGDWAYDAIDKFINLRYRLLPYTYSTSWDVTANSGSMMRALMMDFPNDKKAINLNNEYLFGKSILVCPVTDPLYVQKKDSSMVEDFSTVKTQKVYLPEGTNWTDFWTGQQIQGGQTVEKEVPIDIIPLYVKAGSILPMGPLVQFADEKIDPIEIRIYPGNDGDFTLYNDEHDNYDYEKGAYATIHFHWDDAAKKLTIDDRKGEFPGMLKKQKFQIVLVSEKQGTGLGVTAKPSKTINYSAKKISLKLK
ncbi:glycoside hydrolase family 31 protein [Sunxiuqinia indica]|uniref:glycoside hydrolase family 31 protein n=1 Tax=Sunxiuqinia indica TaxID=2692584 RepID=UPI00135A3F7D|nr:TIM-barrel domain-containing protein [Sunxiuqinia indica]